MRLAKKGREKSLESENIETRNYEVYKKTKAEVFQDKKKTLTNSDKGSCILVPVLLPRFFLFVFLASHKR